MKHNFFNQIEMLLFDFDGVLTDNLVHIDSNGREFVSCSRADGLAFDVLSKLEKPVYILSTEENLVVTARASKLNVPVLQGVHDKR
jgi:3-deoxy-D-manno-octulosonate 8-phosphate phosphatase (KDO 8-P phosphatase)